MYSKSDRFITMKLSEVNIDNSPLNRDRLLDRLLNVWITRDIEKLYKFGI